MRRIGFTLIELLVALAIMAAVLAIVFTSSGSQQRGVAVRHEAERLAAVLRQTRRLAMSSRSMHAVAFNIQNAPGSSGAVLNNRSGGHWYRVLGPSQRAASLSYNGRQVVDLVGQVPVASEGVDFPDFLVAVQQSWVGERQVLAPSKVRFLALADQDEGPRLRGGNNATPSAANVRWYAHGGDETYPRPWFGYFDGSRLWPWGGYTPDVLGSGFYYQGKEGPIIGCVQHTDRLYNNNFNPEGGTLADPHVFANKDRNGDGDFDDPYEQEIAFPVWRRGEPRPLVNADWLDACLMFFPDGSAFFYEWNRARHMYADQQVALSGQPSACANGVRDMGKVRIDKLAAAPSQDGIEYVFQLGREPWEDRDEVAEDIPEVAHFDRHTGGWHITLAPDSADDRVEFASARDALATIQPMWRVFVGRNGVVQPFAVRRDDGYTSGRVVWPSTPATWNATAGVVTNPIWSNCRVGWLHVANTGTANARRLVPRGQAITDVVSPTMLEQRIWWLDE